MSNMRAALVCFCILVIVSCKKDNNDRRAAFDGQYNGYFTRTGGDTARVQLNFSPENFNGSSGRANYPAICGGSYDISENSISFTDTCAWTANFDWSLILEGRFDVSENGNEVRIWRTSGTVTDEYRLTKADR